MTTKQHQEKLPPAQNGAPAKVIRLVPPNTCCLAAKCAVRNGIGSDRPAAAVYALITESGELVRGLHEVSPYHVAALMRACDALTMELHRFYNKSLEEGATVV